VQNSYRPCGKSRQSDSLAACAALESDMTHISGFERSQLLLLPEAIDDYGVADNPVRFIDAFVDGLDLAAAGFKRVTPKVTGRPGYAPGDLLTTSMAISTASGQVGGLRRMPPQHRGHLAVANLEARLQDHRRLPERQSSRLPRGVPPVHVAVPGTQSFRARVDPMEKSPGTLRCPRLFC
jgi:hypothetical protein